MYSKVGSLLAGTAGQGCPARPRGLSSTTSRAQGRRPGYLHLREPPQAHSGPSERREAVLRVSVPNEIFPDNCDCLAAQDEAVLCRQTCPTSPINRRDGPPTQIRYWGTSASAKGALGILDGQKHVLWLPSRLRPVRRSGPDEPPPEPRRRLTPGCPLDPAGAARLRLPIGGWRGAEPGS